MAASSVTEAPHRALVLTERTELALLPELLSPFGIAVDTEAEVAPSASAHSVAVLDGDRFAHGERIRSLRAGGTRVLALTEGDAESVHRLYRSGADVVFGGAVEPGHVVLQCCALLQLLEPDLRPVRVGAAGFEPVARRLVLGDRRVRLTEAESGILGLLVDGRAGFVSRDLISRAVFGIPYDRFDRRIDVHVSNLRRKFRENDVGAAIETSRLNGFRLRADPTFKGEAASQEPL